MGVIFVSQREPAEVRVGGTGVWLGAGTSGEQVGVGTQFQGGVQGNGIAGGNRKGAEA